MIDAKVAPTDTLQTLNRTAVRRQFNRALSSEFFLDADPEGFHIISRVVAFMNDGDIHRCKVLAKMKGSEEPTEVWLDITDRDYNALQDAEKFAERLKEVKAEAEAALASAEPSSDG